MSGNAHFTHRSDPNGQVICTEPAALAGNSGRFAGSYFAQTTYNSTLGAAMPIPGIDTPYVLYRDLFRGTCVNANLVTSKSARSSSLATLARYPSIAARCSK